jgi:hypothetical protein
MSIQGASTKSSYYYAPPNSKPVRRKYPPCKQNNTTEGYFPGGRIMEGKQIK